MKIVVWQAWRLPRREIQESQGEEAKKAKSKLDFPIPRGCGDEEYLSVLTQCLNEMDRINFAPDLILYDAAVDVHNNDKLGLLKMTSAGIYQRDKVVLSHFKDQQVPIVTTIGGGYGGTYKEEAQRHSIIFAVVQSVFQN